MLAGIPHGAVTATLFYGDGPIFDGKGLDLDVSGALAVHKAGVNDYQVCQPTAEGFVDFLELAWLTWTGTGQLYNVVPNAGGLQTGGTSVLDRETSNVLTAAAAGELVMVGKIVRFDVVAGTSTIRPLIGKGGDVALGASRPGKAIAAYDPNPGFAGAFIGAFPGTLYRLSRHYIGRSGLSDDALLARFSREYAHGQSRFA